VLAGEEAPRVVVFVDEIEKAFACHAMPAMPAMPVFVPAFFEERRQGRRRGSLEGYATISW